MWYHQLVLGLCPPLVILSFETGDTLPQQRRGEYLDLRPLLGWSFDDNETIAWAVAWVLIVPKVPPVHSSCWG